MITCKAGVSFAGFSLALCRILTVLCEAADEGWTITITSGSDGQHMASSRHYRWEAVDVRSKHLEADEKRRLVDWLGRRLGPQFSVLLEGEGQPSEHLHLQPRKGHTYNRGEDDPEAA